MRVRRDLSEVVTPVVKAKPSGRSLLEEIGVTDVTVEVVNGVTIRRGTMTREERMRFVDSEVERLGLTDAQRREWRAAGGFSSWRYRPVWTDADEDDY